MVQRNVQTKLGIQADPNVKFEKRLVSLKPSSQFQDGKNRGGADLKKIMKKSRSTKLSDIESLRSPSPSSSLPLRKTMSLPEKPLPLSVQSISAAAAAVPLKQALTKTSDGSAPNYMKSTSCSDARKERSQVSVRNLSNSKLSSGSINKLARTSSLKLVRTLIKSPSFKPARASAKKNSRVAICEDVNIQKATCSSTLKDSKFPKYLMISPGGTEAEGTSVMKVCPYTYCSLNGHHHQPVTPLKCFLSARRRSLKNQTMVKLQSPRKSKPSNNMGMNENGMKQMCLNDNEKPAQQEVGNDYFVEIFANIKDDDAKKSVKNVPEEEIIHSFPREERKEDVADEVYQSSLDQEEPFMRSCSSESESDGLSSIDVDYANSEATEMEWEESQFGLAVLDDEACTNAGFSSNQDGDMHEEPVIKFDAIVSNCNDVIHDYYQILQELFQEKIPSVDIQLENEGTTQNFDTEESERMSYDQFSYTEDSFEEENGLSETELEISVEEPIEDLAATGGEIQEQTGVLEADSHDMESHLGDPESHCTAACETDEAADSQPGNEDDRTTLSTSNQISNAAQDISTTYGAETNAEKGSSEIDQNVGISVSGNQMEEAHGVDDSNSSADIQYLDSAKTMVVQDEDAHTVSESADTAEVYNPSQVIIEETTLVKSEENLANGEYPDNANAGKDSFADEGQSEVKKEKISSSTEVEEHSDLKLKQMDLAENSVGDIDEMQVDNISEPDAAKTILMATNSTSPGMKRKLFHLESNSDEELLNANRKWKINCKRTIKDEEELRKYTQREPNYLPLVPGPEAEKVDLRHQTLDEKKNAEEWMLDFAIQQAVTKLAPARKKKVALLVEAFEKVMPAPTYEPRLKRSSAAFSPARPMQACS